MHYEQAREDDATHRRQTSDRCRHPGIHTITLIQTEGLGLPNTCELLHAVCRGAPAVRLKGSCSPGDLQPTAMGDNTNVTLHTLSMAAPCYCIAFRSGVGLTLDRKAQLYTCGQAAQTDHPRTQLDTKHGCLAFAHPGSRCRTPALILLCTNTHRRTHTFQMHMQLQIQTETVPWMYSGAQKLRSLDFCTTAEPKTGVAKDEQGKQRT